MTGSPPELASGLYRPAHGASRIRTAPPGRIPQQPGEKVVQRSEIHPDLADTGTESAGLVPLGNKGKVSIDAASRAKNRVGRLRRLVIGASTAIQSFLQSHKARYRAAMITLTYARAGDWRPNHIKETLRHCRLWAARRGFKLRGVWVMELQKRGVPHYHILLFLPRGETLPMPDKQGWWTHGSSNCVWARKAVNYITKYASKGPGESGQLPKGARLFGVFGCPMHLGYYRAPQWLRKLGQPGQHIVRGKQGWWLNRTRGWCIRSPYEFLCMQAGKAIISWKGWKPPDRMTLWEYEHQVAVAA